MLRDRRRLTQRCRRAAAATPAELEKLMAAIAHSQSEAERRLAGLPQPSFSEALPVNARRGEIRQAIARHPVVIVCGATGSGKTTQLPKICLELKRGVRGMIGHTQPRRIAARNVAARVATELGAPLGQAVGYKVRFGDHAGPQTYLKLMTDGILLAETLGDRDLDAYDTLIIDEAHERSLNIDFLLGYLRQLLPRRPDLKIIITSATIDAARFSSHFNHAPVIEVSGRAYPVDIRYRPFQGEDDETRERQRAQEILDATDELAAQGGGDMLVFLPGEREIRDTAEMLRKHHPPATEILPLYARQSAVEQARIFQPGGRRRIVLATNVAETSLTVPGIRYVIDPGVARINRYSYRNKVIQLQVEKISQASANQRAGRCGRVMSGICVRLYDEQDFQGRPAFTDPEILRTSLAAVILQMKALRLGQVEDFPFIDPPAPRMVSDGYQLLAELGAVDEERNLTAIGVQLAKLPVDPRIGRMILAAKAAHCLSEVLIIAAALSVQDPRARPLDRQAAADQAHRRFRDERSDFLGYLNLWRFFEEIVRHKKSNRQLAQECRANFLSSLRLREWREVYQQLHAVVSEMGMRPNQQPASYDEIHRALLAGLLGNIGLKSDKGDAYAGARGIQFALFPASALKKKRPKWVMAAELVETTRLYGRCLAEIAPEWVEQAAAPLCRRHYFDPHWERKAARVGAFERVTLYGLPLNSRRRVHYGPINPREAREIFIRDALVAGEFDTRGTFFQHNRRLVAEIEELEHKSRRQDVLADEPCRIAFYDARIPVDIHNGAAFEQWRRQAEKQNPRLLFMTRDDLMRHGAENVTEVLFPETFPVGETHCALSYRFEPGHPLDGMTLAVPLHLLNKIDEARCTWLAPGMIREKMTALLKGLPKSLRRRCVPLPAFVTAALDALTPRERPLTDALADFVRQRTGDAVPPTAWDAAALPAHLEMNFRVMGDNAQELATGRDLAELRQRFGQAARMTFAHGPETAFERHGVTQWDFGDLPETLAVTRGGTKVTAYPALAERGESVSLVLLDTPAAAAREMRAGVRRLLWLSLKAQRKPWEKHLPNFTPMAFQARNAMTTDELREDLLTCIADRAFVGEETPPRTAAAFAQQQQRARARLPTVTDAACQLAAVILADYQAIQTKLSAKLPPPLAQDIQEQIGHLVFRGFLTSTPWAFLQHVPRYLKAVLKRIEKYPGNAERDARHVADIKVLWRRCQERRENYRQSGIGDPALETFRWQIEELRVSLFAQELRIPYPVSVKRLQKAWEAMKP